MKIAVSGKGGVGKTTISAGLALIYKEEGRKVIAVDCDPDMNLGAALNFPGYDKIPALSEMGELIKERTGADSTKSGSFFKLTPQVDDIPEKFFKEQDGIRLMVMGRLEKANSGCLCPENAFLKALMSHLMIGRDEVVILDMVAGIEHLGRGTASAVDEMIVVAEPNMRAIETAHRTEKLSRDLGIKKIYLIGNKVRSKEDVDFIKTNAGALSFAGFVTFDEELVKSRGAITKDSRLVKELRDIMGDIDGR